MTNPTLPNKLMHDGMNEISTVHVKKSRKLCIEPQDFVLRNSRPTLVCCFGDEIQVVSTDY